MCNKELAEKAYHNDQPELDTQKHQMVFEHFKPAQAGLHKTGVIRKLLLKEYLQVHPDGYSYSQYCRHLNDYHKHMDVTMYP